MGQRLLFTLLLFSFYGLVIGQNFSMTTDSVAFNCATGGSIYDSGGPMSDYGNLENEVLTICPSADALVASVVSVNLAAQNDFLCIFDGPTTTSPLLYCFNSSNGLPVGAEIRASVNNPSGCLTFQFYSDSTDVGNFELSLSCLPACQTVEANVLSTMPAVNPTDTLFVDLCFEDTIQFFGQGIYPDNNLVYAQSDATSEFYWFYGDGVSDTTQNPMHFYESEGIYSLALTIEDVNGCQSINEIPVKVRKSPFPDLQIAFSDSVLCLGDTVTLTGFIDGVTIDSVYFGDSLFLTGSSSVIDTTELPDDSDGNPGNGITTPAAFNLPITGYLPGTVLTNPLDLLEICIDIEHSWVGDLDIILVCPNGQQVELIDFTPPGTPGWDFGVPVPGVQTGIGVPGNYCWSPAAVNVAIDDGAPYAGTIPEDVYQAAGNWNDLIGCPLNGVWSIQVFDDYVGDDGNTFGASIEFNPLFLAENDTLPLQYTNPNWDTHPNIITALDDTTVQVTTNDTSITDYVFTLEDQFGCEYSDTLTLTYDIFDVVINPSDTTICGTDTIQLLAEVEGAVSTCDYTLDMYDTWGDGWTGNPISEIEISLGGVFFGSYTLPAGASAGSETITVPAGEILELTYIPGFFTSEDSYEFYGPAGNLLFSDGIGPTPGLVFTTLTCGGGYTYDWTPVTDISATDIEDPSVYPTVDTDYFVAVTNQNNCTFYDTSSIVVGGSFALVMPNDTAICPGDSLQLSILGGGQTFSWTPNDGSISDTAISNPIFSPDTTTTYSVVVDSFGCAVTRNLTITVSDVAIDNAIGQDITCFNLMDGEIDITGINGIPGYTYSVDGISFVPNSLFTGLDTGSYQVFVADTIGCLDSTIVVLAQPDSLAIDAVTIDSVSCNGGADGLISFSGIGGTLSYDYSIDGGTTFSGGVDTFINLSAGSYQLVFIDSNLCTSAILDTTIDEPTPLVLSLDSSANAQCGVANGYIEVSAAGGTSAFSYAINGGVAQTNGVFGNLPAMTHEIIVTDVNGCMDTLSVILTEDLPVVLNLVAFDSVSCNGAADAMLEVVASAGTRPYTFNIDDGTAVFSQPDSVFNNLSGGAYNVWVVDSNGCSDSIGVNIFEPDTLNLTTLQDSVACFAEANGSVTVTATGGTAPYEYSIDGLATTQTTALFANLSAGLYTFHVIDANGCLDSIQQEVFEPDTLLITAVVVQDIDCNGDQDGSFTVTATGGTPSYEYSLDGITFQSSNVLSNLNGGNYTIYVQDQNACEAQELDTIIEPPLLALALDSSINVTCSGGNDGAIYTHASGGVAPYQFSIGGTSQPDSSFVGLIAGNYTVTVTDANGCQETVMVVITEPQALTANITQTNLICFGDDDGVIEIINVTGGTAPYEVQFDGGPYVPFTPNMIFDNLSVGGYVINVSDDAGCPAYTETITITEPSLFEIDEALTVGISPSCAGEQDGSITIIANGGGVGPYVYNIAQAQSGDTTTNSTGVFTGLGEGIYPVWVSDANGCSDSYNVPLSDPPAVVLSVDTAIDESCFGYGDGQIIVNTSGGAPPYSHSFDDGTPADGPGTFTDLVDGQYTIIATDANGCTATITEQINQGAVVVAEIEVDTTEIEMGDTLHVTTTLDNGVGDFVYSWSPSQGLSCSDCANPIILIYNDQEFSVTITDSLGCFDDASIDITVLDELYYFIPDAFTPGNGDEQNDDFRVYGQDIKYVEMQVYSRWGEKLFESNNPYVRWDGTYKGVLQQSGVYTYFVRITFLNDKTVDAKGSISLIR